jgi:UDP-2,3-diacylglucosamine pyrophosphatase LpxH
MGDQVKVLTLADVEVDSLFSPEVRQYAVGVECVLACGDLPLDYLEYILTMLRRPLYYVHGNHAQQRVDSYTGAISEELQGATNLHGLVVNQHGLLIAGLEGCQRYRPGPHQYTQSEMYVQVARLALKLWRNRVRYGRALDILITHAPPRGIHDEPDLTHHGFAAYLSLMRMFKPRYLVHGHTHLYRNDGERCTMYLQTEVINTFGYQLLEISVPQAHSKHI